MSGTWQEFDNDEFSRDIDAIRMRLRQTSVMNSASLDTLGERQREASSKPAISIVYADDDERYRELLRALLKAYPRFRVVGEAVDGQQAVALSIAQRPSVVLLDVEMPTLDGVEAAAAILQAIPEAMVVLHTGGPQAERVAKAQELGLQVVDKLMINETLDRIAVELDRLVDVR